MLVNYIEKHNTTGTAKVIKVIKSVGSSLTSVKWYENMKIRKHDQSGIHHRDHSNGSNCGGLVKQQILAQQTF